MNEQILNVPLEQIRPNPYQMRKVEDAETVAEIAASIRKSGLLEKPSARQVDGGYELVFGHTRLAAFRLLAASGEPDAGQYASMPLTIVGGLDERQMFELGVAENVKRKNLNAIELAEALKTYMEQFEATSKEAGELFGYNESTVRGKVRLLELPEPMKAKLVAGELSEVNARTLLQVQRVAPELDLEEVLGQGEDWQDLPSAARDMVGAEKGTVAFSFPRDWNIDTKPENFPALPEVAADQPRAEHLNAPPACSVCPFHAELDDEHFCGFAACHARKRKAWQQHMLQRATEATGIPIYNVNGTDYGKKAEELSHWSWPGLEEAKANKNIRLKVAGAKTIGNYEGLPGGIVLVQLSPEVGAGKDQGKSALEEQKEALEDELAKKRVEVIAIFVQRHVDAFAKHITIALPGLLQKLHPEYAGEQVESWTGIVPFQGEITKKDLGLFKRQVVLALLFSPTYRVYHSLGAMDADDFARNGTSLVKLAKYLDAEAKAWGFKLPAAVMADAERTQKALVSAETAARAALKKAAKAPASPAKANTKPAAKKAAASGKAKGGKK